MISYERRTHVGSRVPRFGGWGLGFGMEGERGKSVSGAQHNVQHWMGEEFSIQGFAQSTVDEKVELHPVGHVPNHTEDSKPPLSRLLHLPWRQACPPNHLDYKLDSDQ